MRTATLLVLTACAATAAGSPLALIPRSDPDGLPLPTGAVRRLGSGLFRTGSPSDVAFSPDCAVVYLGRYVRDDAPGLSAWDTAAGKPVWHALAGISATKIVPAADDKTLWVVGHEYVNASLGSVVAHVRAVDGTVLSQRRFATDTFHLTQVTPAGRVAVHPKNGVEVYDPGHEKPILKLPNNAPTAIRNVILSRDGTRLLTATPGSGADGRSSRLTGYDLPSGRQVWTTETDAYASLTPHPDGRRIWMQERRLTVRPVFGNGMVFMTTLYEPGELQLWDLATGAAEEPQPTTRYAELGGISSPHFRVGGKSALAHFNGGLAEFELPTWKYKRTLKEVPANGSHWLSPDGNTLAVVNGTLALFDVDTGKRISGRVTEGSSVATLRIDKGNVTLSRGAADETLDLATGREVVVPPRPKDSTARVVAKGGKLVVRRGERERELAESDGYAEYRFVQTPDGKFVIATRSGETARVWDAASGERKHDFAFEEPVGGMSSRASDNVRCAPDSRHVAFYEFDHTPPEGKSRWVVSVWDVVAGKMVRRLTGPGSVGIARGLHWANDGRTLVVCGSANQGKGVTKLGFIAMCDPLSDAELRVLPTDHYPGDVATSADGRSFAMTIGRTIEFWDIGGNALRHTLRSPPFGVNAMAFTPDIKHLVADGPDGTFLYPLPDLSRRPVAPPPRPVR